MGKIVDREPPGASAFAQEIGQAGDQPLPTPRVLGVCGDRRRVVTEEDVVDLLVLTVCLEARRHPGVQPACPVILGKLLHRGRLTGGELGLKSLLQRGDEVVLGGEVEVEGALGDPGAARDILDLRCGDPLLTEHDDSGVEQIRAPGGGGLGP